MGDSGALLLGLLLAAATISLTGSVDPSTSVSGNSAVAIFLPVAGAARGAEPAVARHRARRRPAHARRAAPVAPRRGAPAPPACSSIGHSHRRAVLILYLWAALLALGAVSFAVRRRLACRSWPSPSLTGAAIVLTVWLPRWSRRTACDSFHKQPQEVHRLPQCPICPFARRNDDAHDQAGPTVTTPSASPAPAPRRAVRRQLRGARCCPSTARRRCSRSVVARGSCARADGGLAGAARRGASPSIFFAAGLPS